MRRIGGRIAVAVTAAAVLSTVVTPVLATSSARTDERGVARIRGAVPVAYRLDLRWSPSRRRLEGSSRITVGNAGPHSLRRLWLRLWPNGAGRRDGSCRHTRTRIKDIDGGAVRGYARRCSAVAIDLPRTLAAGARTHFRLRFAVRVPRESDSFGRNAGVDLLGEAMPLVAVTDDRGLHLPPAVPYAEASYALGADWHARIRVPRHVRAAMTGLRSRRTKGASALYTAHAPGARDFGLAFGALHSRSTTVHGVRIRVAGSRRMRRSLPVALRRASRAFRRLQRLYGGYPLKRLDVVVGTLDFGGAEFPGIVASTPDAATISHEVAHQWFYGLVGNDQYSDPWLDESLAAWHEEQFAPGTYRCDPRAPLGGSSLGLGAGMGSFGGQSSLYTRVIYRGGACALTRLERDIGPRRFTAAVRAYVRANGGGVARSGDFLRAVRTAAPSYDVEAWARLVGLGGSAADSGGHSSSRRAASAG
jgi:peptidase M1-like protein